MSKVFTIAEGLQNLGALRTGGQGSVYKGMRMGPVYSAIKLIPTPIYVEDESDKNYLNFLNEVTKLKHVNEKPSPNVVKILSSGITESGSFPYIEMEYIDGPELSELLLPPNQKVFAVRELLKVTEQLASAIAHCHRVGVKHGDIKSNNVKYNVHTANYVLLDFGLAIMSEEQRRTSIRHAGAIEFMAPEQHEGKMLLQSDIYSYGVILYELLSGQVPFPLEGNGDTGRNAVMIGHLEKEVPDVMLLRKNNLVNEVSDEVLQNEMQVPQWLIKVVERCLQKNPADRFADGIELYDAVTKGLLLGEPQGARNHDHELPGGLLRLAASEKELRERNDRLEKELKLLKPLVSAAGIKYDEASGIYQPGNYIRAPKTAFVGLATVCALLIVFLSFSVFTKKEVVVPAKVVAPYESPLITYGKEYQQRLLKAREDSIAKAQLAENLKAIEVNEQNAKKKKRKKFLGIF
ncbi:serine/threonine protein kinase [Pedobacter frigiditerrae]|uniref:Serine/threonine protein kinase n=1 Tax=Pedobacter frigiditerrae TaxID=2530452 RepID=A0A4R0MVX8_9SPHI|nr:serine/threonine-protein kinase [Pedobacter frigiditerrae]TCC90074.1 serine/threonine protein kinase [Pedobacter frigiditerrae]